MPALVLGCGHSFHASCIKRMLTLRWPKARITFGFMGCPLCKVPVDHPSLEALTTPLVELHEKVRQMAKLRLSYEGKLSAPELAAGGEYYGRPEDYGEHIYTYYECFRCKVCVCVARRMVAVAMHQQLTVAWVCCVAETVFRRLVRM